jgi:hypothetical protein
MFSSLAASLRFAIRVLYSTVQPVLLNRMYFQIVTITPK